MTGWQILLLVTFLGFFGGLALYATHGLVMLRLFLRRATATRMAHRERIAAFDGPWPVVTTQIPLFNEAEVAERVIQAVAAIDYPAGRHRIQVLDDSTDGCRDVVDRVAAALRAQDVEIDVVRRTERTHYKAGALAHGLQSARGELVAIFDADFVPPPDFLRHAVPLMLASDRIACVQGRWDHLNRGDNWMTRAQSIGINGHFAIEQGARAWNGLFLNFNGTAGIWRPEAIEQAGGWQGDTLTEDLDLSYRAQLAGWRMVYALDLACPAEIPNTADALKSQQRRWARGSIQTARKLLGRVWRSDASLATKTAATFHLTHYSVSLLMVLLATLTLPVLIWVPFAESSNWLLAAWLVMAGTAATPCVSYYAAGRVLGAPGFTLRNLPGLIVLGCGLSLNNAGAVLAGLFGGQAAFIRTPKTGGSGKGRYHPQIARGWWAELLLGLYCAITLACYMSLSQWLTGLFLGFYSLGFVALGWASAPWARRQAPC